MTTGTLPALLAELASTLTPCPGCGALEDACLERLFSPWRDVCCPACVHHPELPHAAESGHEPAECAAWADGRGTPRQAACEAHWLPDAERQRRVALAAGLPRLLGPSRRDQADAELPDVVWAREYGRNPPL